MRSADAPPPFPPPTLAALAGTALFALFVSVPHLVGEHPWVPLLDSFNLALHEAGHPLVGLLSDRLSVYGGTLFQLLFPALVIGHFWRRRQPASLAVGAVWLGENLLNVAHYMADARAQLLPLVGGGEHDWTEIFSRWGVLEADTRVARFTAFIGWVVIVGALAWLATRWWRGRDAGDEPTPGAQADSRAPRAPPP